MRKATTGIWWSPTAEGTPDLVVTAAFFALGGLAGCLLAFQVKSDGSSAMAAYLGRFLMTAQEGTLTTPPFSALLWRSFRWPLAVFVLGFSTLGLVGIPALASLRGFFLAFSISSFARAYGYSGLTIAFFLLGIPGCFAVPAFFLLSAQSFLTALSMLGQGGRRKESLLYSSHFFRCGVCVTAVCVSLLLERYLVPVLIAGAAGTLIQ